MACIDCGLATNADGKGRVDYDLNGGLECSGSAGGTTNTAGSGLRIKKSTATGNGVQLSSAGLYVPDAFRMETYYGTVFGQSLTGPNTGTSVAPPGGDASITLSNTSDIAKNYVYQASIEWGSSNTVPGIWMELAVRVGGADWFTPGAMSLADGQVMTPLIAPLGYVTVAAGSSTTLRSRLRLYRGFLSDYRVSISAWGGYAP